MACALEIQREFLRLNTELPPEEKLQHRIGIHLGDVFLHNGDVMGDGVNIAARLQTEAVPGGICLSNTVYDVVHNRLPFYVNDLGARKLKNIGTVTAYQISPLENAHARPRMSWYRWRPWLGTLGIALSFLLVLLAVYKIGQKHQKDKMAQHAADKAEKVQAARQAFFATNAPPAVNPNLPEISQSEFEVVRHDLMQKYDFDGMKDWIFSHNWPGKSTEKLYEKAEEFDHLFDWTLGHLLGRTPAKPLHVIGPDGKKIAFWPTAFGGLKMQVDNRIQTMHREAIPASIMVAMCWELMTENGLTEDEAMRLNHELDDFIAYYHVKTGEPLTISKDPAQTP